MSHLMFAELGSMGVRTLANCKEGERVLVLGDTASNSAMLEAFFANAIQAGCEAGLLMYNEKPHINIEPAAHIAQAIKGADVVIDISTQYMIHTKAYHEARLSGTRILVTIPQGIDEYARRGVIGIDYDKMVKQGNAIATLFESSKVCKIRSDQGTNLVMELGGRPAIHRDGMVVEPGEIDYFPGSQVSFAPIEETLNGRAVINGAISPPIGKLTEPVEIEFENGKIVKFEGHGEAGKWKQWIKSQGDLKMFQIAHLSIGLNPEAQLRGFIIEDERIRGSLTLGIGSQMPDFKGTTGLAKTHSDAVTLMSTIMLDEKKIVDKGAVLI